MQLDGEKSRITLSRIQALESLSFEWKPSRSGNTKKASLDEDATSVRERALDAPEHGQTAAQTQEDLSARGIRRNQVDVLSNPKNPSTSLPNPKNPTGMAKSTSPTSRAEPQRFKCLEAGDGRFDETDLGGRKRLYVWTIDCYLDALSL